MLKYWKRDGNVTRIRDNRIRNRIRETSLGRTAGKQRDGQEDEVRRVAVKLLNTAVLGRVIGRIKQRRVGPENGG